MSRRSVALALCACAALAACAGSPSRPAPGEPGNAAAAAASLQPPELVRLRIGDGPVSDPVPHPAFGKATLCLSFPPGFAGSRVDLVVYRGVGDARAQWLRLRPKVAASGPLVVAGLTEGHYELRATLEGADRVAVGEAEVTAPGEIALAMAEAASAAPR